MPARSTAVSREDIRLDLVSMNEWRVLDRRVDESDSSAVLGFIEREGFEYRAIVADSSAVRVCGSLSSATGSFAIDDAAFSAHR